VIHAMSDEQDMRKMGGIWKKIPVTYATMWLGSLALAGIPFFAGYWSKDAILEATHAAGTPVGTYGFICGTLAAFLTGFYSWRVLFMTFHGAPRADAHTMDHVHESPPSMWAPLALLSIGAVFAGWLLHAMFIGGRNADYWQGAIFTAASNHVLEQIERTPLWIGLLPTATGVLGIALAWIFYIYNPALPVRLAESFPAIYRFLLNKWYFDELYQFLFVRPTTWLARELWKVGDAQIIDGIPNGLASLAESGSIQAVRIQTGSIAVYAFTMLIGLVVMVSLFLLVR
jgi:NADH-quinone oxidoreductase subunit L